MAGVDKKGYISCQGESGSCAFGASRVHYFNYTAAPQPSFEEVVRRVVERDAQIGILPIQNSRSGLIGEPLTVLARSDLQIIAEHLQPITHHLMVSEAWVESVTSPEIRGKFQDLTMLDRSGKLDAAGRAELDQITRSLLSQITAIYSDDQGLKQCDRGLKISLSGAERRLTSCTAKASRIIAHEIDMAKLNKQELPAYAAIASEECATMYKNIRLVSGINDDKANTTRYVTISRDEAKAAHVVGDIEIKALLALFQDWDEEDAKNKLPKEDYLTVRLFNIDALRSQFEDLSKEFGFGESSFRAGQEGTARARLLRDYLAEQKDALQALLDYLDFPAQRRVRARLEPLAAEIRDHATKGQGKLGEANLKLLLRSKKYNERVRSIFIIRAKSSETKQAELLKALVEKGGKPRKEQFEFSVISELPRSVDAKDEGLGLVIEADGSLLGAGKSLSKKKSTSNFDWGAAFGTTPLGDPSDLERVLRDIVDADKATIRILGTFAKDPRRLGSVRKASLAAVADKPSRKAKGNVDGAPRSAGASGVFAGLITMAIAAGLVWYAWSAHLLS